MAKSRYDYHGANPDSTGRLRPSLRAGASVLALGALLASSGVFAQDNAAPPPPQGSNAGTPQVADNSDNSAIVVTGIRQSIARALGIAAESITIQVVPEAPAPVAQALQARQAARQALEAAVQSTLAALDALAQEGYQFNDAAAMLGLSPAEIAQYAPGVIPGAGPSPISGPMQMAGM